MEPLKPLKHSVCFRSSDKKRPSVPKNTFPHPLFPNPLTTATLHPITSRGNPKAQFVWPVAMAPLALAMALLPLLPLPPCGVAAAVPVPQSAAY